MKVTDLPVSTWFGIISFKFIFPGFDFTNLRILKYIVLFFRSVMMNLAVLGEEATLPHLGLVQDLRDACLEVVFQACLDIV